MYDCCKAPKQYTHFDYLQRHDRMRVHFCVIRICEFWSQLSAKIKNNLLFVLLWPFSMFTCRWFWLLIFFCFLGFRFHSILRIHPCRGTVLFCICELLCHSFCLTVLQWFQVSFIGLYLLNVSGFNQFQSFSNLFSLFNL